METPKNPEQNNKRKWLTRLLGGVALAALLVL